MTSKPIWKSKTFWANALAATVTAAEMVRVMDYLTDTQQVYFAIAMFGVNIALRMVTDKPVTLT